MVTVNHLLFFFIYIWLEFAILIFPYPSISIQIKPVLPEKIPLLLPNRITPVRLAECSVLSLPYIRQRIASVDHAVSYYVLSCFLPGLSVEVCSLYCPTSINGSYFKAKKKEKKRKLLL